MATVYIAPTAQGSADGTSAANAYAYSSLSTAESDAGTGGLIYFLDGTYTLSANQTWDGNQITYKALNNQKAVITSSSTSTLLNLTVGAASSNDIVINGFHFKNFRFIMSGTGVFESLKVEYLDAFSSGLFGHIYANNKRLDISNSTFDLNFSASDGLIYKSNGDSQVTGCVFNITATGLSANSIYNYTGGTYDRPNYKNCIFTSNNSAAIRSSGTDAIITTADCTNCCIHDFGTSHTVTAPNISDDPQFVDSANGDYRLRPSSPCINAGTAS